MFGCSACGVRTSSGRIVVRRNFASANPGKGQLVEIDEQLRQAAQRLRDSFAERDPQLRPTDQATLRPTCDVYGPALIAAVLLALAIGTLALTWGRTRARRKGSS